MTRRAQEKRNQPYPYQGDVGERPRIKLTVIVEEQGEGGRTTILRPTARRVDREQRTIDHCDRGMR
jgi:hypothetical protein